MKTAKGLDSDTIWTLKARWINQTDADCSTVYWAAKRWAR